jgi:hypothetical protein
MRSLVVLAAALWLMTSSVAAAEPAPASGPPAAPATSPAPAPAPAPPTRSVPRAVVVAILPGGEQAVLWDADRGGYVVVKPGDVVQGRTVSAIDPDGVVLADAKGVHYVLPFDEDLAKSAGKRPTPATPATPAATPATPAAATASPLPGSAPATAGSPTVAPPVDPYGDTAPLDPYDPYRQDQLKSVTAAHVPPAAPLPASTAPGATTPPPGAPAAGAPATSTATPAAAPTKDARVALLPATVIQGTSVADDKREESYTLRRGELDAAFGDFTRLGKEVRFDLTSEGIALHDVAKGTFLYRMGLRGGDLVRTIDGQRIRGVDDAASVYARLMTASRLAVEVQRGGTSITFRYVFTR